MTKKKKERNGEKQIKTRWVKETEGIHQYDDPLHFYYAVYVQRLPFILYEKNRKLDIQFNLQLFV